MKTTLHLIASLAVGCLLFSNAEAAGVRTKRLLAAPTVTVAGNSAEIIVSVTGGCQSTLANLQYDIVVSVNTSAGQASGIAKVEKTVRLVPVDTDDANLNCNYTDADVSFTTEELAAAVAQLVASLVPADATIESVVTGCETVSVKALSSTSESPRTAVQVAGCN